MRIKNKEIRARRHRKEDKIKDAARELRAKYGSAKTAGGDKAVANKKSAAPKPTAKAAPKKAADAAPKPAAAKKPAAPKAKKAEPTAD